jgi:hypothetical protein
MNYKKRSVSEFIVTKIDHIVEHIIPFFDKHPILGSKHLNFLDFKSAAYIIKNKEHLNEDGLGLEQILELKRRITSLYSNKAMNNHSVVNGTEKFDQKRQSEPLPSHIFNMAKPSNCGKILKTNLPN